MLRRALLFGIIAGLLLTAPAAAAGPALTAQPPATPLAASDKRSGVLELAGGAHAYLPKGRTGAPAPVLVALHGAGGEASQVISSYRRLSTAQRNQLIAFLRSL